MGTRLYQAIVVFGGAIGAGELAVSVGAALTTPACSAESGPSGSGTPDLATPPTFDGGVLPWGDAGVVAGDGGVLPWGDAGISVPDKGPGD